MLRQTADVFSENETQSSQGSDKAPSEDNLAPDEIADVIPIEEDKDLFNKAQIIIANRPKPEPKKEETVSPTKRRVALMPPKPKAGKGKRNDANSAGKRHYDTDNESGQDEPKKTEPNADEGNVHKKKIKKNVDSRDACTQTDRSDYMLIKQR